MYIILMLVFVSQLALFSKKLRSSGMENLCDVTELQRVEHEKSLVDGR